MVVVESTGPVIELDKLGLRLLTVCSALACCDCCHRHTMLSSGGKGEIRRGQSVEATEENTRQDTDRQTQSQRAKNTDAAKYCLSSEEMPDRTRQQDKQTKHRENVNTCKCDQCISRQIFPAKMLRVKSAFSG